MVAKALSLVASGWFVHRRRGQVAGRVNSSGAPFRPLAPSTLGTWLRSFTFGHLRQFDRANGRLARLWVRRRMTLDLDSTVCEVHGRDKHGTAYGHTKVLGYHPLVAVRDDTGEFIHSRMRSGSSQRGHMRFVSETLARLRRLAPDAKVTVAPTPGSSPMTCWTSSRPATRPGRSRSPKTPWSKQP